MQVFVLRCDVRPEETFPVCLLGICLIAPMQRDPAHQVTPVPWILIAAVPLIVVNLEIVGNVRIKPESIRSWIVAGSPSLE